MVRSKHIKVLVGIILLLLAAIIFLDPMMNSQDTAYLPSYIDTEFIPLIFGVGLIMLGVVIILSA